MYLIDRVKRGEYSLSELFQLLDEEKQALDEIRGYKYYDDKARQIAATKENINAIWEAIHKLRGMK